MSSAGSGSRADRPGLAGQVVLGLALFGVYVLVDSLESPERSAAARHHGQQLLRLEGRLHIDIEHRLNDALAPHHVLSTLANYEYAWTYLLSTLALLAWIWVRHPHLWRPVRDVFVVVNLLAIAVFWLWPTMPPRLLGEGYVDTVVRGTIGSWGTGVVDASNQLAAMPSLHLGWAIFVSYGLARAGAPRWLQWVSAAHVLLTAYVIFATGNHYVLDAAAAFVPVWAGAAFAWWRWFAPAAQGEVVPASDAFFLHVEETGAPQHVGGVVVFETPSQPVPTMDEWRTLVAEALVPRRRFAQRLAPPTRWRRPRWVDTEVDLDWHVVERHTGDGEAGLRRLVAETAAEPLPRDRPLWRFVVVRDIGDGRPAVYVVVHHAMADGLATVAHTLRLFQPILELPRPPSQPGGVRRTLERTAATVVGLAQLATDGGARKLPSGSARRQFGASSVGFDDVREVARAYGVRVTDVVLTLVGEGIRQAAPAATDRLGGRLRVALTQALPVSGESGQGNATGSVMVDVPVDDRPLAERLADVARATQRRRRPTRLVASRFVVSTGLRLAPEPAAAWFARRVYGSRFFHAVVSNLPGPPAALTMLGIETRHVLPILPVAPGAMTSIGALAWSGRLGFGIAADPALLDADAVAAAVPRALAELRASAREWPAEDQEQASAVSR
ncbi:MAG TPA: phosphatase PAP2 family protein [Nocardioides sp.]|uniref:bifunctional phosphatase PAP2/O-acyltransferase family protein n=1 Tax=Nocardioides sp. TaxID=35761 RepID=UPI002E35A9B5|nr:phosphatase PAP2 family protein [Nocardioides sp.]HEX5087649.1 phosphatase PAP2 family protein [Nocardioides sp.]